MQAVPMKKLALTALTAALALTSSHAFARQFLIPGSTCQPVQGAASCVDYTQFGIHNICSAAVTVECPIPVSEPIGTVFPTVNQLYFSGYDRSTVANESCTIQKVDSSGNAIFSATASIFAQGVGSGIQFGQIFPNTSTDGFFHMRCSIPGVQTAGAFSHLTGIYLSTTE